MFAGLARQRPEGAHLIVEFTIAIQLLVEAGGDEGGEDAVPPAGTQHHCPGPVPEKQAGGPVSPVGEPGADIRADDQGVFALRSHQPLRHIGGKIKTAATRLQVEGRDPAAQSQFLLDADGPGRKKLGRGVGPQDDVAQLLRLDPRILERPAGGDHPHGDRIFLRRHDAALMHPATFHDPGIRGIHQLLLGAGW